LVVYFFGSVLKIVRVDVNVSQKVPEDIDSHLNLG